MIESQGALQEGGSGKCNETQSVSFYPVKQVCDSQFDAFQAVRAYVPRQHTLRYVQGNEDVDAGGLGFLLFRPPLRASQSNE